MILRQYTQRKKDGEVVKIVYLHKELGALRDDGSRRAPKYVIEVIDPVTNQRTTWMPEHDDLLVLLCDLVACYRETDEQFERLTKLLLGAINGEIVIWNQERYETIIDKDEDGGVEAWEDWVEEERSEEQPAQIVLPMRTHQT